MVWDGIVACDLFCAGLGAWTFIFSVLSAGKDERLRKAKLVGVIVAFALVALGALILAVDARGGLLNPLRYFNLLGNLGSVMAWGVILISLFLVGAFACAALLLAKRSVPRVLEAATALVAVGVSVYTGVLLSTSPAFPLWNLAVLPIAFVVSAAYTGYAAYALVARFTAPEGAGMPGWLGKAAVVLPVLEAIALAALVAVVSATQGSGAEAAAASVAGLVSGACALVFWGAVVAVGLVVPFVLAVVRARQGSSAPAWMGVVEWACILVGGFAFRYAVVMAAVPIFA